MNFHKIPGSILDKPPNLWYDFKVDQQKSVEIRPDFYALFLWSSQVSGSFSSDKDSKIHIYREEL